ncbi:MAG: hypothetical protein ACM3P1_03135 [Candidatus Saccharibacteria bacterium]
MKQSVLIILCVFLLGACSAFNRIQKGHKNGLETMRLAQSVQENFTKQNNDLKKSAALKVNIDYLYEEKTPQRPEVTIQLKNEKAVDTFPDSVLFITLSGENIQLFSSKGRYIIAENLWVPIVHSPDITYQLNTNHTVRVLTLSEKQKAEVKEFFHKVIKQRDELFPAIPPGQKKW